MHPPEPPILTDPEKQAKILEVIAKGGSPRMAARAAGIDLETLEHSLRTDPDLQARFDQAQFDRESKTLDFMREAAKTNWRAAAWFLEREDPQAFRLEPEHISLDELLYLFSSIVKTAIRYIADPEAQKLFLSGVDRALCIIGLADDPRFQDVLCRHLPADAARDHFDPANGDSSDQ